MAPFSGQGRLGRLPLDSQMLNFWRAGTGNRTRINSLEGCGFTTKLCPQWCVNQVNSLSSGDHICNRFARRFRRLLAGPTQGTWEIRMVILALVAIPCPAWVCTGANRSWLK